MTAALKIIICPDGVVRAGPYVLKPSSRHFRKRRVFWRALLNGKPVTAFVLTPELALAAAERFSPPPRA